jgi:hypothetical protein
MSFVSTPLLPRDYVSVKAYGAVGDGVTDDRAAINSAIAAGILQGKPVYFPYGQFLVSRQINIDPCAGLYIYGDGTATVIWPSDDDTVTDDAFTNGDEMARSAFAARYCNGLVIEGVNGRGGDGVDLDINIGSFVYLSNCVNSTLRNCKATGGSALFVQDSAGASSGTGDSLTYSAGVVTVTDAAGSFKAGHVGLRITIGNATNEQNNGAKIIKSVVSSTVLTYEDPDGVTETSSFTWAIDDSDRGTLVEKCHSLNQRGSIRTGSDSVIRDCLIERPTDTLDLTGIGDTLSISGSTVTLVDANANFPVTVIGKFVRIASATSAGNNNGGANPAVWEITARPSATSITFENASGVSEAFTGTWWIANGEKAGLGAGALALAQSGSTTTLTSATAAFTANDVDKSIRIAHATTAANNGVFKITGFTSSTVVTYENTSGVAETFASVWTIDSFDRSGASSAPNGSTHGIYFQSGNQGRNNCKVLNNTFKGIRTTAVKDSGSAVALRSISIIGNTFIECGEVATHGADDTQDHNAWIFQGNTIIDCGTQRAGATQARCISILGARSTSIVGNTFHFSRNAIGSVDGLGISGVAIIHGSRYVARGTQPLEDVLISLNKFTADPSTTTRGSIASHGINMTDVGVRAKWGTLTATLAISGSTMTLTDSGADFHPSDCGKSITIVNATSGGNNGTFTILTANGNSLTYTNAGGANASAGNSGTYRIPDHTGRRAGGLVIHENVFDTVANTVIIASQCVGTDIVNNTITNGILSLSGDCMPRISGNRFTGTYSQNAHIQLSATCSWPIEYDNFFTNSALGATAGYGASIGLSSTAIDHPLLGKRGIIRPTQAFQQVVFSYGTNFVDGDTVVVVGTGSVTYTYKASSPSGNQFNTKAGLIALINAQAGLDCVEFGTHLTTNVATGHILVTKNATSATDGEITVGPVSALNPTALVLLRNDGGTQTTAKGRGAGSAGPIEDKAWIPSPLASGVSCPVIVPNNAAAQAFLVAEGWRPLKSLTNSGCGELIQLGAGTATTSTDEYRWVIP